MASSFLLVLAKSTRLQSQTRLMLYAFFIQCLVLEFLWWQFYWGSVSILFWMEFLAGLSLSWSLRSDHLSKAAGSKTEMRNFKKNAWQKPPNILLFSYILKELYTSFLSPLSKLALENKLPPAQNDVRNQEEFPRNLGLAECGTLPRRRCSHVTKALLQPQWDVHENH